MSNPYRDLLETRLPAIRTTDVILAALQAAFGGESLVDGQNPFKFIRDDPVRSRVWVCDPDSRVEFSERDGVRNLIMVQRGDYVPSEMHLHNRGDGNWDGTQPLYDMASTMIIVQCEAGNKTSSEMLASICYAILKHFRNDLLAQYDVLNLRLHSVSPAARNQDVPGAPWVCQVIARLETQERLEARLDTNRLNHTVITSELAKNHERVIAVLDTPPDSPSLPPPD